jgi:hypothetical protein
MWRVQNGFRVWIFALRLILLGCLAVCFLQSARAVQSVALTWNPSTDPAVVGYKIYYGTVSPVSQNYTNVVVLGNVTTTTISGLADGTTYYFAATTYDAVGDESAFSNEASFTTPSVTGVSTPPPTPSSNASPKLANIADVTVNENAGAQTVNLSGIAFSGNMINIIAPYLVAFASKSAPTLKFTVASSNPSMVPTPTINYTSPKNTGTLVFKPVANVFGTATITVSVNNGAKTDNLVTKKFTITVLPNPQDYPRISKPVTSSTVLVGKTVSLNVTAAGLAPLKYQWQLNGVNIPSATSATLTLKNVKATQAGNYSVIVSNKAGSTNSTPAFLTVESTTPAQVEPQLIVAPPAAAAILTSVAKANGQFGFQVIGTEGSNYVVQASVDLKNWVSVQTNTSPFLFTDPQTGDFNQRFYRAYPSP